MMIVGSVPTNGVASTMHTVRKFLGALTLPYIAGFMIDRNWNWLREKYALDGPRSVFSSSLLIDFRNSNDLSIISLTLLVVFLLFQRSLTFLNYSYL